MAIRLYYEKFDPALPTILCISSEQFVRDLIMLQRLGTRYNWVAIADGKLEAAQVSWMPKRLQMQGTYVNEEGPDVDAAWDRARAYGLEVIAEVKAQMPSLVAVMAGNWDYWNEECMRLACREVGLPFLVLLREHHLTPDQTSHIWLYEQCKSIPRVDAVAVAGQQTYDFIRKLNLHPENIVRITGFPRLDIWSLPTEPLYDRPVVLFSYTKAYGALNHFNEMLRLFNYLALRHPSVPFLIKAKHQRDLAIVEKMMQGHSKNLKIVDDLSLPALIKNARAISGFRSISLYESLFACAPILIPYWGEAAMPPEKLAPGPGDERLKGYMEFCTSPEAYVAAMEDAILNDRRTDMSGRDALFSHYFKHSPTETASARVEQFVAEFVPASRA